ncbi:MAG TPA: hypothetical protein VFB21_07585 [Chthonomonadaceae bacterium]|nr:hypothetical protein [Chthonomonadaceae bacterium]
MSNDPPQQYVVPVTYYLLITAANEKKAEKRAQVCEKSLRTFLTHHCPDLTIHRSIGAAIPKEALLGLAGETL